MKMNQACVGMCRFGWLCCPRVGEWFVGRVVDMYRQTHILISLLLVSSCTLCSGFRNGEVCFQRLQIAIVMIQWAMAELPFPGAKTSHRKGDV